MRRYQSVLIVMLLALLTIGMVSACSSQTKEKPLPPPSADVDSPFFVDKNINMTTIDEYLDRSDVAYRDVRMLFDPADYAAVGGDADLSRTIRGFKVVPFPYIATLQPLPVKGAYQGERLFDVDWADNGTVANARARYAESEMILEELFPRDKAIFLMCGGAGYSNMIKELLIYYGWDVNLLYNTGANWGYAGKNALELIVYPENANDDNIYATWRADYAYIDFSRLHPIQGGSE